MIKTIDEILKSKTFVKEGSGAIFRSPTDYLMPFVDTVNNKLSGYKITSKVSNAVVNMNDDGSENVSFGRVNIQADGPVIDGISMPTIGIVYGLDINKPVIKVYTGTNVSACTNLCVFNPADLFQMEIMNNLERIYSLAEEYAEDISKKYEKYQKVIKELQSQEIDMMETQMLLGGLLMRGVVDGVLGTNGVVMGTRELMDKKSVYSIKEGVTTKWNIYNAITQYITDKVDILDKPSKTLRLSNYFIDSETIKMLN